MASAGGDIDHSEDALEAVAGGEMYIVWRTGCDASSSVSSCGRFSTKPHFAVDEQQKFQCATGHAHSSPFGLTPDRHSGIRGARTQPSSARRLRPSAVPKSPLYDRTECLVLETPRHAPAIQFLSVSLVVPSSPIPHSDLSNGCQAVPASAPFLTRSAKGHQHHHPPLTLFVHALSPPIRCPSQTFLARICTSFCQ